MNEKELERLLKSYGDSVPSCPVPALRPQPLRWPRFATVGIATAAVAGIAVVGLWPHDAVAGSLARLHRALTDAKTMEFTMSMKIPSGWHPYLHGYCEGDAWQFESQLNTNLDRTVVRRDGMELVDFKNLDHATLDASPPDDDQFDTRQTALDFAKKNIDSGHTDIQRTVTIHPHDPVDGRPAYAITMERPSDHYLATILVDKQTDLPIESSIVLDDLRPGFEGVKQEIRTKFQFNKPIDPKVFDLYRKGKTVIRMQDARDQIKQMWRTPLGTVDGAEVRAATITRDGTLWIATTASGDRPMLPGALVNAGVQSVRGGDFSPGQLNIRANDDLFGKPIYVTAFAPLPDAGLRLIQVRARQAVKQALAAQTVIQSPRLVNPQKEIDQSRIDQALSSVTIRFSHRDASFVNPGRLLDSQTGQSELLTVKPTREDGTLPSYFPMLGLDRPNFSPAQSIWRAKAQVLEAGKQYQLAAEAYSELAKARYGWVKYSAYEPMLDEARCYRLVGQTQKADELTAQAAALKASRER